MEESLALEHCRKLHADAYEDLLDGRVVADESAALLEALRRNVTDGSDDIVGDPLHEVRAVLVLDTLNLLVHLLHGHASAEHGSSGEVPAVARIGGGHHVLGIEHLLGNVRHAQCRVFLRAAAGERGKPGHEEVETREGNHVDSQLAQVGIELAGESEARGDATHGGRDKLVQIVVGWCGQLEGAEADVIECLIVDAVSLVRVLHQLMDGEYSIVRLQDDIGHLRGRKDTEGAHYAIRELLADLGHEKRAHTRPSSPSQRVRHLEALEAVAGLRLLPHYLQHRVHQLSSLRVVTLGPDVTCSRLPCEINTKLN